MKISGKGLWWFKNCSSVFLAEFVFLLHERIFWLWKNHYVEHKGFNVNKLKTTQCNYILLQMKRLLRLEWVSLPFLTSLYSLFSTSSIFVFPSEPPTFRYLCVTQFPMAYWLQEGSVITLILLLRYDVSISLLHIMLGLCIHDIKY